MNVTTIGIIGMLIMLVLLFAGMNLGFAFLVVGCVGYGILSTPAAAIGLLRTSFYSVASNYNYSVIPLFILMGEFSYYSGLSSGLYNLGNKWLSRLPGGLACATVAACAGFGAICGSLSATTATMGTIAIPEMRKHGYDDTLSCGSIAAGGTLGILIPPSTTFIIYGISAEVSIGALFASGMIPGIVCVLLMIATIVVWCKLKPGIAPKAEKFSWKERFLAFKELIGVIILFGFVFGGMFAGVFTVNEAAGVGATLAGVMMLLRRKMNWANLKGALLGTLKSTAMIYLIMMGANVLSAFIAATKIPSSLAAYVAGLQVSPYVLFAAIVFIYMFLGCIMDGLAVILLTVPIFLPIIKELGFDPVWFGTIIILTSQIGGITPPVGISCYVLSGVAKDIQLSTIFRGIAPFLIPLVLTIVLLTIFPGLSIWLPGVLYG